MRQTSTLQFVFVHLGCRAIPLLHVLRQDAAAILTVPPQRNVTLSLAVVLPERNVSLFADQAIVHLELNAVPEITERCVLADILSLEMAMFHV